MAGSETAQRHLTHTSYVFSLSPTLHTTSGSAFLAPLHTTALLCRARRSSLTNPQQRNSAYREPGVWEGEGWGDSLGPVTLQKHFPVTPASKALHFTNMNAKTSSNGKHHDRSF